MLFRSASYSRNLQNCNNTELRNSFHEGTEVRIMETHIIDVARIFQRGGHTWQSEGTHQIVMSIQKSFLKKGFLTMAKILSWHFHHLL